MNANQAWAALSSIMTTLLVIAGWGLALLLIAKVAQIVGVKLPLAVIDHTTLLYMAGAYYLIRK